MKVELIEYTPNPERVISLAGRVCHDSFGVDDPAFIGRLIEMGHESVLEHASATFVLSGLSRALTHQLVRHRLVSYSQRSQRYVEESDFEYVTPPSISLGSPPVTLRFLRAMEDASRAYAALIRMGIPKEDARFVLPNACYTTIVVTANFRQWRHMIRLRISKHAQWEIRAVFKEILRELTLVAPSVFSDFGIADS